MHTDATMQCMSHWSPLTLTLHPQTWSSHYFSQHIVRPCFQLSHCRLVGINLYLGFYDVTVAQCLFWGRSDILGFFFFFWNLLFSLCVVSLLRWCWLFLSWRLSERLLLCLVIFSVLTHSNASTLPRLYSDDHLWCRAPQNESIIIA